MTLFPPNALYALTLFSSKMLITLIRVLSPSLEPESHAGKDFSVLANNA